MTRILFATGNNHKLQEAREILNPHGIEVLGANDVGGLPDVVEDGDTFRANAIKKAVEIAAIKKFSVISDDSGLEVFSLDGRPGIHSARYSGKHGDHAANIARVLNELGDNPHREARFVCVIAVVVQNKLIGTVEGEVRGTISRKIRGNGGFGYDPIFIPEGYNQTFAELPAEVKNSISHRGNALQKLVEQNLLDKLLT